MLKLVATMVIKASSHPKGDILIKSTPMDGLRNTEGPREKRPFFSAQAIYMEW